MKRQRSRNRGGGGGGKPQHNANRAFDSNGPDGVKIRGNAQHVFEKYQQLARDAQSSGDRVLAENYLQHAEHYFRVLRAVQPQRPASEIIGRDAFTSGIDIDFEDESGPGEATEGEAPAEGASAEEGGEGRSEQRSDNGRQDYRDRGEYRGDRRPDYRRDEYRQDRPDGRRDDRQEPRQDRDRYEGRRDDRDRDRGYNRDDRQGRDRDRDRDRGYNRDDRQGRFEGRDRFENRDRYEGRPREGGQDPLPTVEPEATPLPRGGAEESGSHTLRSQDGAFSPAPAFLQARQEAPAGEQPEAEATPEPRRRRSRGPRPPAEPAVDES